MNSKEILLLNCLRVSNYLDDIEDEKYLTKEILSFLKIKPEYSIKTLIFKRYYVLLYIIWNVDKDFGLSYNEFERVMCNSPKNIYKNDMELKCEMRFVLETFYTEYDDNTSLSNYKEIMKNFELAYGLLYESNLPRVFLTEAIIKVKCIRKFIKLRRKK